MFKNVAKNQERTFYFLDICIWTDCCKLSVLQREYLWSTPNMLRNNAKISDITNRGIFQLYFPQSDEKIW